MNLEEELKSFKISAIELLKNRMYEDFLYRLDNICYAYMRPREDYDRYDLSPYSSEVSDYYNLDYLNASFINIGDRYYLACQEPKFKYENIFINLIIKSGINTIVALKNKNRYFNKYEKIYEEKILNVNGEDFIINEVFRVNNRNIRRITCEKWPDHGMMSFDELMKLSDYVDSYDKDRIIVHCKAGVGRTGTFIMFNLLKNCGKISLEDFVKYLFEIRKSRPFTVQSKSQLQSLVEFFVSQ